MYRWKEVSHLGNRILLTGQHSQQVNILNLIREFPEQIFQLVFVATNEGRLDGEALFQDDGDNFAAELVEVSFCMDIHFLDKFTLSTFIKYKIIINLIIEKLSCFYETQR